MTHRVVKTCHTLATAGFVAVLAVSAPVWANDGYSGLFAPSEKTQQSAPAPATGYQGLIAPPPEQRRGNAEPLGYSGVVQGQTPQPAPSAAPVAPTAVGNVPRPSETLKTQAAMHGLATGVTTPQQLAEDSASRNSRPQERINGMLPVEFAARQNIERMFTGIRDPRLNDRQRAARVKQTAERFNTLIGGLRNKQNVPDSVYRSMGASETFIAEQREGNARALARLEAAMQELRRYQ